MAGVGRTSLISPLTSALRRPVRLSISPACHQQKAGIIRDAGNIKSQFDKLARDWTTVTLAIGAYLNNLGEIAQRARPFGSPALAERIEQQLEGLRTETAGLKAACEKLADFNIMAGQGLGLPEFARTEISEGKVLTALDSFKLSVSSVGSGLAELSESIAGLHSLIAEQQEVQLAFVDRFLCSFAYRGQVEIKVESAQGLFGEIRGNYEAVSAAAKELLEIMNGECLDLPASSGERSETALAVKHIKDSLNRVALAFDLLTSKWNSNIFPMVSDYFDQAEKEGNPAAFKIINAQCEVLREQICLAKKSLEALLAADPASCEESIMITVDASLHDNVKDLMFFLSSGVEEAANDFIAIMRQYKDLKNAVKIETDGLNARINALWGTGIELNGDMVLAEIEGKIESVRQAAENLIELLDNPKLKQKENEVGPEQILGESDLDEIPPPPILSQGDNEYFKFPNFSYEVLIHQGPAGKSQQDAVLAIVYDPKVAQRKILFGVADGISIPAGGEKMSLAALDDLRSYASGHVESFDPKVALESSRFAVCNEAVKQGLTTKVNGSNGASRLNGPGTTLVFIYLHKGKQKLYLGAAGDTSIIYATPGEHGRLAVPNDGRTITYHKMQRNPLPYPISDQVMDKIYSVESSGLALNSPYASLTSTDIINENGKIKIKPWGDAPTVSELDLAPSEEGMVLVLGTDGLFPAVAGEPQKITALLREACNRKSVVGLLGSLKGLADAFPNNKDNRSGIAIWLPFEIVFFEAAGASEEISF